MVRKRVDDRVLGLIRDGIRRNHRSVLVMVGDRGRNQVANIYAAYSQAYKQMTLRQNVFLAPEKENREYILGEDGVLPANSVSRVLPVKTTENAILWCYDKDLGFTTHRIKRMKQLRKKRLRGCFDTNNGSIPMGIGSNGSKSNAKSSKVDEDDLFAGDDMAASWYNFLEYEKIRFCRFREIFKISGQNFNFLILQDFFKLRPNILLHSIETIHGGGVILILLTQYQHLELLYQLAGSPEHSPTQKTLTKDSKIGEGHNSAEPSAKRHKSSDTSAGDKSLTDDTFTRTEGTVTKVTPTEPDLADPSSRTLDLALNKLQSMPRFAHRFIKSLTQCHNCLICDDELNILPLSDQMAQTRESDGSLASTAPALRSKRLDRLLQEFPSHTAIHKVLRMCITFDQAHCLSTISRSLLACVEKLADLESPPNAGADDSLHSLHAILAARGRGKSAALGLSIGLGLGLGLKDVIITSPSPENVKTVFQFIGKALTALGYSERDHLIEKLEPVEFLKEILDDDIPGPVTKQEVVVGLKFSSSGNFHDDKSIALVRYVFPHRIKVASANGTGEIEDPEGDEARTQLDAATPASMAEWMELEFNPASPSSCLVVDEAAAIPTPCLVNLMGKTASSGLIFMATTVDGYEGTGSLFTRRVLQSLNKATDKGVKELGMSAPIRYGKGDPIETWLRELLCLKAWGDRIWPELGDVGSDHVPKVSKLLKVDRDVLFSLHPRSEDILSQTMSLFSAAEARCSPDDLFNLSDDPARDLFVILDQVKPDCPSTPGQKLSPTVLCALEVSYEGTRLSQIGASKNELSWVVSSYFGKDFTELIGAEICKLAPRSECRRLAYKALRECRHHLSRDSTRSACAAADLKSEGCNSLFVEAKRAPQTVPLVDYVGARVEVTQSDLSVFFEDNFKPVWISVKPNAWTGNFALILLRELDTSRKWLEPFCADFGRRFASWLQSAHRSLPVKEAHTVLDVTSRSRMLHSKVLSKETIESLGVTVETEEDGVPHRLLEAFFYFRGQLGDPKIDVIGRQAILGWELQNKPVDEVAEELGLSRESCIEKIVAAQNKIHKLAAKIVG